MEEFRDFSFRVKLTEKDVIRFVFMQSYRNWALAGLTGWSILLCVLAFVLAVVRGLSWLPWQMLVFPAVFLILIPGSVYYSAKKSYKSRLVQEEKAYRFESSGIRVESESVQAQFRWEDYKEARFTRKAIYLYISKQAAHVLPFTHIPEGERAPFEQLIRRKVVKLRRSGFRLLRNTAVFLFIFLVVVGIVRFLSGQQ